MAGGGGLHAVQEPRRVGEEEKAGRQHRAGGMKFRVSARAPHGVGALLLIGGAVLAGVAWRRARRDPHHPAPKKEEVSGDGVVEDGKGVTSAPEIDRPDDKVEGGASPPEIDPPEDKVDEGGTSAPEIDKVDEGVASPREIDRPDDSLRGEEEEEEETVIGSNGLDNGGVTEEIQEVHHEAETVADELDSERAEKFGLDSRKSSTEISMHDDADGEQVEKFDQNSIPKPPEISRHDMGTVTVEKGDENSTEQGTESDHNSTKNDTDNDQCPITNHMEDENSSKNNLKEDIAPNDNEDVEASDECSHSTSRPGIVLDEHSLHGDAAQEAESMENSPTAQLMMHPEQLLDDMAMDTEGETAEAKPRKGTVSDEDVHEQQQQKAVAEPDGLAGSPALSSLVKPTEKKEPEVPGRIVETGMKIDQDYTNGGLKVHDMITEGGAVMTMDRRSSSLAILALVLALTIGITIVVRLYAPPRATKLQMDLQ